MYKWLENVELSSFRSSIDNFINHLVDPATLAIPDDPVFISYKKTPQLRLISAGTLQELLKQLAESHKFIEIAPLDKSGISMVVQSSEMDNVNENELKAILQYLVNKNMDRGQIRMVSSVLNFGLTHALNVSQKDEQLSIDVIKELKRMMKDEAHLVDEYLKILKSPDISPGYKLLPQCLEDLITQQMVELETHRKKLRDDNGEDLLANEVICPLTRQVIDVQKSLSTQSDAAKFIMLSVALAKLAKLNNNDLEDYISTQGDDYINKCFEQLQSYVKDPVQFGLSGEKQEFLNQLGMNIVLQHWEKQNKYSNSVEASTKSLRFFNDNQKEQRTEKSFNLTSSFSVS